MKTTLILLNNATAALSRATLAARKAATLPRDVMDILIGQMLGDGSAVRRSPTSNVYLTWSIGSMYGEYARYLANLIKDYTNKGVVIHHVKSSKTSGLHVSHRLTTVTLPLFNVLHEMFYVLNPSTGRYVKFVPCDIMSLMTPVVLAHLIMGDGNFHPGMNVVRIYTNSFTYDDCVRLADSITNIGIRTEVIKDMKHSDGTHHHILRISSPELYKLHKIVIPHMHPSMYYRVGYKES